MGRLIRRIQFLLLSRRMQAELAEEMEFHRAMLNDPQAMGNTTLAREDARAVWIAPWLEGIWRDLVYGVRGLRRQPGFTLVALLTLGSAIGLNTSLFTLFNAFALRPWEVRDSEKVAAIFSVEQRGQGGVSGFSIAEYRYLASNVRSLEGVVAMRDGNPVQLEDRPAELVYTSGNYFRTLGIGMALGRGFQADEDRTAAPSAVAVLSYAAWQNRFGGDPAMIGKSVRIDGIRFTVVGVAAASFTGTFTRSNEVWAPFSSQLLLRPNDPNVLPFLTSADYCCTPIAGRLRPGVTRERARAEIHLLLGQFHPETIRERAIAVTGTRLVDRAGGDMRSKIIPAASLMFAAVILVLLLACANIGNLLLARAAARRKEIAVRLSLGGSRRRVIRQLLLESLTLSLAGAAVGLAIAMVLPAAVMKFENPGVALNLAPDGRVLAYTALLACFSSFAFGLAPALHGTRGGILDALKGGQAGGSRLSLRGALLAVQVAVSVVLLTSAGLLVGGLQRGQRIDPGFAVNDVTVVSFALPNAAYGPARMASFARHLMENLDQAAVTMDAPLSNSRTFTAVTVPGDDAQRRVCFHQVSAAYFDILRIPIVRGRGFAAADAGRPVLLINETAAKRFFPGGSAPGQSLKMDGPQEIVGVVKDAHTTELGSVEPTIYAPMPTGRWTPQVLVRGGGAQVERVTAVARAFEPRVQVTSEPLAANFQRQFDPSRRGVAIAGTLGLLALLLAAVGMSGVFAYVVQQRTREIGVRMALGAGKRQVIGLVLRSSLRSVGVGLVCGMLLSGAASLLLASQFTGVASVDLPAYAAVLILLTVAAAAASAVPARRAARIDPVRALRWE